MCGVCPIGHDFLASGRWLLAGFGRIIILELLTDLECVTVESMTPALAPGTLVSFRRFGLSYPSWIVLGWLGINDGGGGKFKKGVEAPGPPFVHRGETGRADGGKTGAADVGTRTSRRGRQ